MTSISHLDKIYGNTLKFKQTFELPEVILNKGHPGSLGPNLSGRWSWFCVYPVPAEEVE